MTYVLGALAGAAFGGLAGLLKYVILWRGYLKKKSRGAADSALYGRMLIGYLVNAAVLVAVFLARKSLPFDFYAAIIAAALALSLTSKAYSITRLTRPDQPEKKSEE